MHEELALFNGGVPEMHKVKYQLEAFLLQVSVAPTNGSLFVSDDTHQSDFNNAWMKWIWKMQSSPQKGKEAAMYPRRRRGCHVPKGEVSPIDRQ